MDASTSRLLEPINFGQIITPIIVLYSFKKWLKCAFIGQQLLYSFTSYLH